MTPTEIALIPAKSIDLRRFIISMPNTTLTKEQIKANEDFLDLMKKKKMWFWKDKKMVYNMKDGKIYPQSFRALFELHTIVSKRYLINNIHMDDNIMLEITL